MTKRFNVSQAKDIPGRDKPVWLKHGVAFEKEGKISIKLESLPIPNNKGEIWLRLFEDDGLRSQPNNSDGSPMKESFSGRSIQELLSTEDDAIPF